jgi:hypothetical protein
VTLSAAAILLFASQNQGVVVSCGDASRTENLIHSLEDPDIDVREESLVQLRKMLPAVAPILRAYLDHPDAEVRARCRDLLNQPLIASKVLMGKVVVVDHNRGLVATDFRYRDGVQVGQRLEIWRQCQRVGTLAMTEVLPWGSWAEVQGDLRLESIQKGDDIQAVVRTTKRVSGLSS